MEKYQLIIRKNPVVGISLAEMFAHGRRCRVEALPFRVPLDGLAFVPPNAQVIVQQSLGKYSSETPVLVASGWEERPVVNGAEKSSDGPIALRNGDAVVLGQCQIQFFHCQERRGVSFSSCLPGRIAKFAVYALIVLELLTLSVLPGYLRHSTSFERNTRLQGMFRKVDKCNALLNKLESADAVMDAYYNSLREEFTRRMRYLRRYSHRLSDKQLESHLENLERLEALVGRLLQLPDVSLGDDSKVFKMDIPVQKIIEEYK